MTQKSTARLDTIEYTESTSKIALLAMLDDYDRLIADMPTEPTQAQRRLVTLCRTRDDDRTLAETLYNAARNVYYRTGQTIELDDAYQSMLEYTIEELETDPDLDNQTTAYIATRAHWHARRIARANRTHDRRNAAFALDATDANDRPLWETIGSDSMATVGMQNANLSIDLKTALETIDRTLATALTMRELYGMPYDAIADAMQTTQANARQMVTRARKQMRAQLPLRKHAPKNWTLKTAFAFAGMDPDLYTAAKHQKTGRKITGIARTDNRYRFTITYGNGQTETIGHRTGILVTLKTGDELTNTETIDRKCRTTDPNAPAPACLPLIDRPQYKDEYTYEDIADNRRAVLPARNARKHRKTLAAYLAELETTID